MSACFRTLWSLILCLRLAGVAQAQETEAEVHLFILSGQSNMAGLNPDLSFTPRVEQHFGKDRVIVVKHVLRNALIPVVTIIALDFGILFSGALITETIFAWPGMGQLAIQALYTSDYPLLQGLTIVFTLGYVGVALAVDILYAYIDPRIRFA